MRWLRLYSEVLHDPKVQRLPPSIFKHWINLLCLANESEPRGTLPAVRDIAFALRIKPNEAEKVMEHLRREGLVDSTRDGRDFPHNWPRRQRESDDIAQRVARHRERKSAPEAESGASSNGHVTLHETLHVQRSNTPDTDTDTDTERDPDPDLHVDHQRSASSGAETAPAVAADAEFSKLCREIAKAAGVPLQAKAIRGLIENHPKLDARQIVYQVRLAAEWIADPDRNHGTKSKPPRKMGTLFLHNWLNRAQEPPSPAQHNGHAGGGEQQHHGTDQPDFYELRRRRAQAEADAKERDRAEVAKLVRQRRASSV